MSTRPNLMGKLEIPVNLLKSNCLTKKLARRVVDAGIETRVEHEELILEITELDNW